MTHRSLSTPNSGLRVFSASLLSALMILMPFVQLAAAEQRSVARSQRSEPQGAEVKDQGSNATAENLFVNPAAAVGITATKSDAYPSSPGPAVPGEVITYTVDVANPNPPGNDATGVTFMDIIDPQTTLVGGFLTVSPLAINDTYAAEQNVPLSISAPGVLTNDTGVPAPTATAIVAGPTTAGGTVTLNTDGSFTYTPINAGFTGPDTFTYTITNGNAPPNPGVDNLATVTINVDARPTVTSTTPTDNAINQAGNTDITVTFSEPVNVTGSWFQIVCTLSGTHNVADTVVTGGPSTFTINPNSPTHDFTQGESCTVTVVAAQVTDVDSNDPPNNMAADYIFDFTMDAAPSVTATTPVDTATGVGTQSNITLTFSESVSLTAAPVTISCATSGVHTYTVVTANPNTTFTINPTDFVAGELCTVTVLANQVSDTDTNDPPNNMVGNYIFTFTTDVAPTVTGTTPTAGATNVASDTSIVVNFSETVNVTGSAFTLTCNSIAQPFTLIPAAPGGVNSFTLDPTSNFPAGSSCTMTVVATQVSDTDGGDPPDTMVANHVLNFSVDAAPTVTANTPLHNATGVANNTNVTVTFSENVDVVGNWFQISCASSGTHDTTNSVVSGGPLTHTINPNGTFTNGEICTVTIHAGQIEDQDTNDPPQNMAAPHVFTFTVDNPPAVTTTIPANSATDIAQNSTVTINFSENVNVAAGGVTINCGSAVGFTPALPALNTNSLVLTPTGGLPAGSNCTVTVVAANVTDTDAGDPPDNMVADHVFTFKVKPDAVNDSVFTATAQRVIGNVSFNTASIPYSATTNDVSANAFTVSAFDGTSANGGTVVMTTSGAGMGQFTYNPPRGFEGDDTFNYTISRTDGGGTDTATVTINVLGMIWFIQDGAVACGLQCGRLSNPYPTLAAFNVDNALGGLNPDNNDNIFIYEDATGYSGAVTMRSGQKLIGQDATATLASIAGVTVFSGSTALPAMNTGGNTTNIISTVTMHNSTTVRGLSINSTSGSGLVASGRTGLVVTEVATLSVVNSPGVAASFTSSSGTFTFTNISASGTGAGLNFASTTSVSTVNINNITTVSGAAFTTSSTGTTDFTVNNVTSTTGTAVGITTATGDFIFHAINANGGSSGIDVDSATGTFTVNGTSTTDGSGGTIQNATSRGAEFTSSDDITLKNMNFTNNGTAPNLVAGSASTCGGNLLTGNNLSCESQIHLQTVATVSLDNLNITGGDQMGINGNAVSAFTLANSSVTGNGNETFENGLTFQNLTGTCSITDTLITDNFSHQVVVANIANSSTLTLGVTGTRTNNAYPTMDTSTTMIGRTSLAAASEASILFNTLNTSTNVNMTLNITGVVFNFSYPANAVFLNVNSASGSLGGTTTNSSFDTTGGGLIIQAQNGQGGTYNITNSEFNRTALQHILYSGLNPFNSTLQGTVQGNTIGTAGHSGSACFPTSGANCVGIDVNMIGGTGALRMKIGGTVAGQPNTVQQFDNAGIRLAANGTTSPVLHATIQNNAVQNPLGLIARGIDTNVGTTANANVQGCFTISGNTFVGTWDSSPGTEMAIHTRVRFLSEHRLPGMTGTGAANAVTWLTSQNPSATGKIFSEGAGVPGYQSGAACTTPLLLAAGGIESALNANPLFAMAFPNLRNEAAPLAPCSAGQAPLENATTTSSSLTQPQLDTIVSAAMQRWTSSGLNESQIAAMRELRFEVGNLSDGYLGEASGNRIVVDSDAQGKGWFVDFTPNEDSEFGDRTSATRSYTNPFNSAAGRIDLLTAIEHEIGHKLGLDDSYAEKDRDSIMYGYLTVGERRMPARGEAANAQAGSLAGTHFLKLNKPEVRGQRSEVSKNHARNSKLGTRNSKLTATTPASGETLNHTIGALPAGKSVRITFKVTVDSPFTGTQVSNQGSVSGALNSIPFGPVVTDDPDTGAPNDATVTQIQGPPDAVDDAYTSFKNTTLNIAAPGVLTNDTSVTSVTAVNGSGANVGIPVSTTPAATGTVTVNSDGSFTYTPPNATFTGGASFTYEATGTSSDTATVNITVVDTSAIYINEVLFHPDGTGTSEYIELRGPISGLIPAGTYLVVVDGDAGTTAGDVTTIINLSGLSFGTNGFLVLLQNGNTYTTAAGATVITSTTTGFGGLGLPSLARWSADGGATSLEDSGASFMLIQTGTAPSLSDDIDTVGDDGTPDGTVYAGWSVRDSVGHLTGVNASDRAYGAINYITGGSGTGSGTVVTPSFISVYVGRICDSTGSAAADWVASEGLGGSAPNWTLGSNTEPASFAGNPLDHIGTTNFVNNAPVNSVPGTQTMNEDATLTFNAGNLNLISIADSDAGSGTLSVTISMVAGQLTLSQTTGLVFSNGDGLDDGTMTFTGNLADINAALNGLLFEPTTNDDQDDTLTITVDDQGNTGGAACSTSQSDSDTVAITVNSVNDAPVLDNTGTMALNSIPVNIAAGSNTGTLVSDIIASAGGNRITDVDAGAVEGLAVITVDNSNGAWEYSTTGSGGPWTAFGSPTDATARLLAADANTRIRFQPNAGFSGTRSITFRAWDQTSGTNGGTGDASVNGGATAFSTDTETASITVSSNVSVQDATVAEPTSGTTTMVFTVSLNAPAPAGGVSVNFTTQDEPAGPGKAVAGVCGGGGDYVLTSGTINFAAGQQVKTINVPVCSDATVEPDETFLVVLSSPVGVTIVDGTATGTIKSTNTAGTLLISELRTSGPGGAGDDFVEIYNNTNSPHMVAASDASAGYGVFIMGADCNATPILVGIISNGIVLPARGHFLFVGSAYSLGSYATGNATLSPDIPTDANVAIFSTTDVSKISSVTRYDAVGFGVNTGGACDLLREGSTLPPIAANATLEHSYFRKMCDWLQGQGCTVQGTKDTNNNADDFWLADTTGSAITGRLGAPGPENLASPIRRDNANNPGPGGINVFLLDGTVGPAAGANRDRNGGDPAGTFGSMKLRYRVTNNTGASVTRLRYRIVDVSTAIQPVGPVADLRALTSSLEPSVGPVHDSVTCTAGGAGAPPCSVAVQATTLETPPNQAIGGGYNSTLSSGTITTITPLINGQSILINFKLGVEKTGQFRFYIIVEALP